jgi:hypothetical protein
MPSPDERHALAALLQFLYELCLLLGPHFGKNILSGDAGLLRDTRRGERVVAGQQKSFQPATELLDDLRRAGLDRIPHGKQALECLIERNADNRRALPGPFLHEAVTRGQIHA